MQFADVPGFETLKTVLTKAAAAGHIAHAQMFAGQSGSAALPLALAYATYINCTARTDEDSCGLCPSCSKYNKLIHPDLNFVYPVAATKDAMETPSSTAYIKQFRQFVHDQPFGGPLEWGAFFGAENKQLNIAVSEARYIISTLSLKAYEAKWKVMIIWLPEFMNQGAANAILKVLEEPTPDTLFILVTEAIDRLLPTILSRVQMIKVPPFENDQVQQFLIQQGVEPLEARTVAMLSEGSLSEARRLLQENTSTYFGLFTSWMRACYGHKYADILQQTEQFSKLGREGQKGFFQYTLSMLREALLAHEGLRDLVKLPEQELDFVTKFSAFVHTGNLPTIMEHLGTAWAHVERNANAKIVFFDTSLYLCQLLRIPAKVKEVA